MSIISEALKKAQEPQKLKPYEQKIPQIQISKEGREPSRFYWIQLSLLFLAVVVAWSSFVIFQKRNRSSPSLQTNVFNESGVIPLGEASQPASVETQFKRGPRLTKQLEREFQLSGIALIEGQSVAIINGNVLKEGDQIHGARLVKVTQDVVTLDYRGEEIKLSLK